MDGVGEVEVGHGGVGLGCTLRSSKDLIFAAIRGPMRLDRPKKRKVARMMAARVAQHVFILLGL